MSKFYVFLKNNEFSSDRNLGVFANRADAVDCAVNKVASICSREEDMAREALERRDFYCVEWSSNEVYIEERNS